MRSFPSSRRSFLRTALTLTPLLAVDPQRLVWRQDARTEREVRQFIRTLRRAMRAMLSDPTPIDDDSAWLGTALEAAGVTTQTTVIPQSVRQAGLYTSSTFTIPSAVSFVRLFANIGLSDKLSTGLLCDLTLERSTDGVTFASGDGFGWTSYGPDGYHTIGKDGSPIDNPDPSLGYHVQPGDDTKQFRLVLSLPQPLTLGATVEVTTG